VCVSFAMPDKAGVVVKLRAWARGRAIGLPVTAARSARAVNKCDDALVCDPPIVLSNRLFALKHQNRRCVLSCVVNRGLRHLKHEVDAARQDHDVRS
jgi:hypothetical protein